MYLIEFDFCFIYQQSIKSGIESLMIFTTALLSTILSTVSNDAPKHAVCLYTACPIVIDGKLEDTSWRKARWINDFVDIEGSHKPKPYLRTRVKLLWDDEYLYVGAELQEPHVWGNYTARSSPLFLENNFEVFIDPDSDRKDYFEFEVNALGTIWDLMLTHPYKEGGKGINLNNPDIKVAVHVDGTLNDPRDTDKGWSVELAIPWKMMAEKAGRITPPKPGDTWRMNLVRTEWPFEIVDGKYQKPKDSQSNFWVWSPQGAINMHLPEKWGYVEFKR